METARAASDRIYTVDGRWKPETAVKAGEGTELLEEKQMATDSQSGSGFSWFLAGLGLGSLLGVLYAPRAGQDTREDLLTSALGSREYVRARSREAQHVASEYVDRSTDQVKGQVNEYVSRGKDAVEQGRKKVNEVYSQSKSALIGQKEKISAAYEAGKQAYNETEAAPVHEELIPGSATKS